MDNIKEYESKYNEDYGFEKIQVGYRRKKVLEIIAKHSPKNLLEVGCGIESISAVVEGKIKCTIVEPSKDFVETVKSQVKKTKIIQDYLENIEANDKYDFILLSSLLHEVPDPIKLLNCVKLFCHKNTVVHVNVPNARSLHRLLGMEMGVIENQMSKSDYDIKFSRHNVFDMEKLQNIILDCGFQVIDEGSYFIKPLDQKNMLNMFNEELINKKYLDSLYEISHLLPQNGSEIYMNVRINE